jgi:hypothetical protein
MRKVWISFCHELFQRQDPIRNKALWAISEPLKIDQKSPIPKLTLTTLLQQKVNGLFEPSIPSDKTHMELPSDTDVLAIEEQNSITFIESPFRSFK